MNGKFWAATWIGLSSLLLLLALSVATEGWRLPDPVTGRGGWVYEYQGLIAGLLALAVGALTVLILRKQISSMERIGEQARRTAVAALNQPLVVRLEKLSAATERAAQRMRASNYDWSNVKEDLHEITDSLGAQLDLIDYLRAAQTEVIRSFVKFFDEAEPSSVSTSGALPSAVVDKVINVGIISRVFARALANGGSVRELARDTADFVGTSDPLES